jgi:RNA 2',3'-cyclic 3'-phosphodiesterase
VRLFVAVSLPDPLAALLGAAAAAIAPPGLRATRRESLHVTVHFLGEVDPAAVPELSAALASACAGREPFTLRFDAVAPAPPRRPRMLWARAAPSAAYAALALAVAGAAASAAPAARPARTSAPHVTLARARAGARVRWPEPAGLADAELAVETCLLVRSEMGPGGSRYTDLHAFPLGAQGSRRR